jgi:hypothetical protein
MRQQLAKISSISVKKTSSERLVLSGVEVSERQPWMRQQLA